MTQNNPPNQIIRFRLSMLHHKRGLTFVSPLLWWIGVLNRNAAWFARGARSRSFAEGTPLGVSAKSTTAFQSFYEKPSNRYSPLTARPVISVNLCQNNSGGCISMFVWAQSLSFVFIGLYSGSNFLRGVAFCVIIRQIY